MWEGSGEWAVFIIFFLSSYRDRRPAPSTHPIAQRSPFSDHNVHHPPPPLTPIYDALKTNLPHPLMAFSDFPFPPSTPLYPKADVVASYLKSYAETFVLYKHIRFNKRVVKVEYDSDTSNWTLHTTSTDSNSATFAPGLSEPSYTSDLLFVCNGHHNLPRYPHIPGIESWLISNRAAHSAFYRNPECAPWKLDKTHKVLVVGGGPSGRDIVTDLMTNTEFIKIVHSTSKYTDDNGDPVGRVKQISRPVRFGDISEGKVEFEGDMTENGIDYVILATGYEVHFPFLSEKHITTGFPPSLSPLPNGVWNTTYGVFPLVRYLFPFSFNPGTCKHSPSPTSIFFLGLLVRVVPMPLVQVQARVALAILANKLTNLDWTREAKEVLDRYDHLRAHLESDRRIHKAWFRFEPMEQFAYRDALVDLLSSSGASSGAQRVKDWEREIYLQRDTLCKAWQVCEAKGTAAEWLKGVGEGKSGKGVENEWVDLMWRVLQAEELWRTDWELRLKSWQLFTAEKRRLADNCNRILRAWILHQTLPETIVRFVSSSAKITSRIHGRMYVG